jgi:hypothetical protein
MKRLTIIFCTLSAPFASDAWSNGWMVESPYVKSGDMKLSKDARLIGESINFTLSKEHFTTEVSYSVNALKTPLHAELIFPVLCKKAGSSEMEIGELSDIPCVDAFDVTIDGKKVAVTNAGDLVAGFSKTAYTKPAFTSALTDQYYDKEGIYPEQSPEIGADVTFYRAPIATDKQHFTIAIKYKTPYYFNWSGFTKRSFYYYSDDIVYYDLNPASSWTGGKTIPLHVSIDQGDAAGPVKLPQEWGFKMRDGKYVSTIENFSLTERKLIFAVNQRDYKQYKAHLKSVSKYAKVDYSLSSGNTLTVSGKTYSPSFATDGDTSTAWCSSKNNPELTLTVSNSENEPYGGCYFEGIGLINGYAKNQRIWLANRRVKSGMIEINGDYHADFQLRDAQNGQPFYPYSKIAYISSNIEGVISNEKTSRKYWSLQSSDDATIHIKIVDTFPGAKYQDVCISEIYPIYNCP